LYSACRLVAFPVLAPSERVLKMDELALLPRDQVDAHYVEPDRRRCGLGKLPEVGAREPTQHQALVAVDGYFSGGHILRRAGLDFDKAQQGAVPGDQIKIAGPVAA
jgi:hypothetical protein